MEELGVVSLVTSRLRGDVVGSVSCLKGRYKGDEALGSARECEKVSDDKVQLKGSYWILGKNSSL